MNNNINKSINYNNCPTDGNIYRTNDICIENISAEERQQYLLNNLYKYVKDFEDINEHLNNTYQFVVHNSTNKKLNYYVQMYEESEYDINLKYRLRRNNDYVVGDDNTWVTANELKTAFSKIDSSSSDSYSLDWILEFNDDKDAEDTLAGSNMESNYKLDIRFYFESIEA